MKILVVEDEGITAEDIMFRLEDMEHTVTAVVASREEAIQQVAETEPDFVLMDIALKGEMDGIEAAAEISDRFGVSVIYVTAHGREDLFQRAKKTRPFGYILKPLQDMQFSIAIEVAIELYRAEQELKGSNRKLEESNRRLEDTLAELREMQGELVRRERMRVMGQMAQGIVHSLSSGMAGISGLSHVIRKRLKRIHLLDGKDDFLRLLASIIDSAEYATGVVQRLRTFYRPKQEEEIFHPVDLNKMIQEALGMTRHMLEDDAHLPINVVKDLEAVSDISGKDSDVIDLLISLISNAVEAMLNGGTLTIQT